MKKWIYIGIGAIVVVVAIIIFGLSNLGPIIKRAVNSYGPEITKTELHVDDVGVSIFSGEGIEISESGLELSTSIIFVRSGMRTVAFL